MSSIFNKNYVSVTYKDNKTDYPTKFCKQIIKEFNIPTNSKILDIGCGDGAFAKAFEELGMEVYGLDISEAARDRLGDSLSICNLLEKPYPQEDASFDFVFSKSVVEHLREPDILIDEAYRLLKPGGMFICMTPSWKHSYKEAFYIDHTHVTPFTRHSLNTACELSGFQSKCDYFYQLPLMWKYPILNIGRIALNLLHLPYRPFSRIKWPNNVNKAIRFSKEAMLLCKAKKV
jgi:SAM-dependent methyltransferase